MRLTRTPKDRRRTGRTDVTWEGRFGLAGQPEWEWQPCTIDDISGGGARLTASLPGAASAGDAIAIAVDRLGTTTVGITLRGRIAHVTPDTGNTDSPANDRTIIGVALIFATPQERRVAESIFLSVR